ncbi:ras and ef-hand domain-containing protein [Anaeramoeba flamelloides]|uniref:Ras and ef-hand domain-containing protein n=1 Tax=Anaeramoeba flamelloides TaxID=1746091 RepID=A0AAV7YKH5_9EUKA|nr:ras and ef-hand domain-containing protein [Anaeramoeba flamelloides]
MNKFKICFIGDAKVGKTSIITRWIYDTFETDLERTVGVDFLSKTVHIDNKAVRLQLWDTAGQEKFRCLLPSYIRNSSMAIIVCDITNPESFENIDYWYDQVKNVSSEEIIFFLVANKTDLAKERKVSNETLEKKAKENDFHFIETSAKTGNNIKSLFRKICLLILEKESDNIIDETENSQSKQNNTSQNLVLESENESNKNSKEGGCC